MKYDLAKKLKDAGFSQGGEGKTYLDTMKDPNGVYAPTISELIKACGETFNFVCRNPDTGKWGAETFKGNVVVNSETPEEAVANLWLEINKK